MIQPLTATQASSTTAQPGGPALGKQEFLKLLITQLRNQDPLSPLDQNQFLAQTAQFSSLESLQNISSELSDMKALALGQAFAQGAALLGKTALASGRDVTLGNGPAELSFTLAGSGSVEIDVLDVQNTVVRHLTTGPRGPGAQVVEWDGRDSGGNAMTPGLYHYRVTGQGGAVAVAAQGTLNGMTPTSTGVVYRLGDATVRADDLITIG
jgi:flagellar basal-body rod modification protein FlgD